MEKTFTEYIEDYVNNQALSCRRKKQIRTREFAINLCKILRNKYNSKTIDWYLCSSCKFYHIGNRRK